MRKTAALLGLTDAMEKIALKAVRGVRTVKGGKGGKRGWSEGTIYHSFRDLPNYSELKAPKMFNQPMPVSNRPAPKPLNVPNTQLYDPMYYDYGERPSTPNSPAITNIATPSGGTKDVIVYRGVKELTDKVPVWGKKTRAESLKEAILSKVKQTEDRAASFLNKRMAAGRERRMREYERYRNEGYSHDQAVNKIYENDLLTLFSATTGTALTAAAINAMINGSTGEKGGAAPRLPKNPMNTPKLIDTNSYPFTIREDRYPNSNSNQSATPIWGSDDYLFGNPVNIPEKIY